MKVSHAPASHPSRVISIPDGVAGTRETLKLMADIVRSYKKDSTIRQMAGDLVQYCPSQSFMQEVKAIFQWVKNNVRYLQDVNEIETLQTPDVTLNIRRGDCDDHSVLLASLLESIGHPCRFIALGYSQPGQFEHVYTQTLVGTDWVGLDSTVSASFAGWCPEPPYSSDIVTGKQIGRAHV